MSLNDDPDDLMIILHCDNKYISTKESITLGEGSCIEKYFECVTNELYVMK